MANLPGVNVGSTTTTCPPPNYKFVDLETLTEHGNGFMPMNTHITVVSHPKANFAKHPRKPTLTIVENLTYKQAYNMVGNYSDKMFNAPAAAITAFMVKFIQNNTDEFSETYPTDWRSHNVQISIKNNKLTSLSLLTIEEKKQAILYRMSIAAKSLMKWKPTSLIQKSLMTPIRIHATPSRCH